MFRIWLGFFSLAFGYSLFSWGTLFRQRDFEVELSRIPYLIVAHVAEKKVLLVEFEGGKRIYTYFHVNLEDVLKGKFSHQKIRVRTPGGAMNGIKETIAGGVDLDVGQRVVLFLSQMNADGSYDIFSLRQGVVFFEADGTTLTGPILNDGKQGEVEPHWNSGEISKSQNDTGAEKVWNIQRIKDFYREKESSNNNDNIGQSNIENPTGVEPPSGSALPLQIKAEQAQVAEEATHGLEEKEFAQSEISEEHRGGTEKMDLMLVIIVGFLIILVIPFILYQLLRKKSE